MWEGEHLAEVETVLHDSWAEVVLNRPKTKNSITGPLGEGLAAALRDLDGNDDVQVIVLRGAGGAFCSGLDLKAFNADPEPDWLPQFGAIWRGAHKALYESKKPIIAALERYAINGGAALAADLLIVGASSFLQVGEVKLGMAAPYNLAWLRLRHSENVTAKLAITGRRFSGEELASLGVAYESVADDTVVARAFELAGELAANPAGANARIKAAMRIYNDTPADEWFDRVTRLTSGARVKPKSVT